MKQLTETILDLSNSALLAILFHVEKFPINYSEMSIYFMWTTETMFSYFLGEIMSFISHFDSSRQARNAMSIIFFTLRAACCSYPLMSYGTLNLENTDINYFSLGHVVDSFVTCQKLISRNKFVFITSAHENSSQILYSNVAIFWCISV